MKGMAKNIHSFFLTGNVKVIKLDIDAHPPKIPPPDANGHITHHDNSYSSHHRRTSSCGSTHEHTVPRDAEEVLRGSLRGLEWKDRLDVFEFLMLKLLVFIYEFSLYYPQLPLASPLESFPLGKTASRHRARG
jgi:hypothetical protein